MDTRPDDVEVELADGDAHAAGALIAEAQDALAVRDDDEAHVLVGRLAQYVRDATAVVGRDPEAAAMAKHLAVHLAGPADRRRVDDREHLLEVLEDHAVVEDRVARLQIRQRDVFRERIRRVADVSDGARDLLFLRPNGAREQARETQRLPVLAREPGAAVVHVVVEQIPPAEGNVEDFLAVRPNFEIEALHLGSLPASFPPVNVVLLGATKGMGRALARRMAERGERIALLGRNLDALDSMARDLVVRGAAHVVTAHCDLESTETFEPALDLAEEGLGGLDTVVVTAGIFATQDELERDPALAARVLTVDFTNTVLFSEAARKRLLASGGGKLCVFSSVAGERGRKPVIIYGASKAGLSAYLEGLDHKFRADGLEVITVKPGFVKTTMTEGLDPPPFAGEADAVAARVLDAIDHGQPVVYAPVAWGPIMAVIRTLPRFVMRRVGF